MSFYRTFILFVLLCCGNPDLLARKNDAVSILPLLKQVRALMRVNKIDSSLMLLDKMYRQSITTDNDTGLIWYYIIKGDISELKEQKEVSKKYYEKALDQNQKSKNDPRINAIVYNKIGVLTVMAGDYENSAKLFLVASEYAKKIKDLKYKEHLIANISLNIAQLLISIREPHKALYYLDKTKAIATKNELHNTLISVMMNEASCHILLKNNDIAMKKYQKALSLCKQYKDIYLEQSVLGNIGSLLIIEGNYEEAIKYFKQTQLIDDAATPYYTISNIAQLGLGYYHIGDYINAEKNLLNALSLAEKYKLNSLLPEIHNNLSKLHEARGRFKLAQQHLRQYIQIKDSISGEEQIKNIQQLETKYQSALKDKELAQNQVLLQRKNNLILLFVSITLLLLTLTYAIYRHKNKLHKRKIRILQQIHEIKAVKSTMEGEEKERIRIAQDLHDGIGGMITALNMQLSSIQKKHAIQGNGIYTELDRPLRLISDIAGEIRQTSRNLIPETLLNLGFADSIRQYFAHIEENSNTQFNVQFYGDMSKLSSSLSLSLYRIIQEIAQNIIKHAEATEAVIQLREHKDKMNLYVEDNGKGFDINTAGEKGQGLANIQARVKAMKGYFSISSSIMNGTTIHIEMDIEKTKPPQPENKSKS